MIIVITQQILLTSYFSFYFVSNWVILLFLRFKSVFKKI
jgi:hypothetical protein